MAYAGEARGNGTEAARIARYKGNDVTLVAYENLRKPQIYDFIQQLRKDAEQRSLNRVMSANEVLIAMSRHANADIGRRART